MTELSHLLRCKAVGRDGRKLGRVCDVWACDRQGTLELEWLVVGRPAFFVRLGLRRGADPNGSRRRIELIPWSAVRQVDDKTVVVDA